MSPLLRTLICLAVTTTLLASVPARSSSAQAVTTLTKQLIDGEWQTGLSAPAGNTALEPSARLLPPPTPSYDGYDQGHWRRYVYTTHSEGNDEIYLYTGTASGTMLMNLTNNRAADTYPRLNHTADQVVFVSERDRNREIYLMKADGTGVRRLTASPADDIQPFWSPDSKSIVFASTRDGNWNLYRMSADGTNLASLTNDPGADLMPAWSPDGKTIAWVRAGATDGVLWLMNADGTNQRPITGALRYLQHPAWSPDGTQLAIDYDRNGDGFNELAILNANGSGLHSVTVPNPLTQPGQRIDLASASWSPSGSVLIITVYIYNVVSNRATLVNAYVGSVAIDGSTSSPVVWPAFYDRQADLQSLDLIAPHSTLASSSGWTRGNTTTVGWDGSDEGVSDYFTYDLQYRVGTGVWVDWKHPIGGIGDVQAAYSGHAGETVSFRIRAHDAAGNTEPWHEGPSTTFFDTLAQGRITDNRAKPLSDVQLNLNPAAIAPARSGADGQFTVRLVDNGPHTISAAAPGYLSPPVSTLPISQDVSFSPYLLPADNQVQNGGFEAAGTLSSWSASGSLSAIVTTTATLTGQRAAQLGQACAAPCLTAPEIAGLGSSDAYTGVYAAGMAVDQARTLHLLWPKANYSTFPTTFNMFYATRTSAGTWSAAQQIPGATGGGPVKLVIDDQQTLHAIWVTSNERLMYSQRPAGGSWSVPDPLGGASLSAPLSLIIDHSGQLFVLYSCGYAAECPSQLSGQLRKRNSSGQWLTLQSIPSTDATIAIGSDDQVHVLWEVGHHGYAATLLPDGTLSSSTPFGDATEVFGMKAVVNPQGLLQIVWFLNQEGYYVEQLPDGSFALPQPIPLVDLSAGSPQLGIDRAGTLYLANAVNQGDFGIYFRTKPAEGAWTQPTKLYSTTYGKINLIVDDFGAVQLIRDGGQGVGDVLLRYQTTLATAGANSATLKQTVAIPADMHKPTLAFMYTLGGTAPGNGSLLEATITQGAQTTSVFSSTVGGWSLASIDMQPWAGKTVDLAITLHQAAGAPPPSALIDDVSLGSWLTPVIQQVSPAAIQNPTAPTELTISGENFVSLPAVYLGALQLADVQLIDEHTLKVTAPAGVAPGRYALELRNPSGQRAIVASLVVGRQQFLPTLVR